MSRLCEIISAEIADTWACEETMNGVRVPTTCVLPSFEPLFVYVVKIGDGFIVHDAGETLASMLAHGQAEKAAVRAIRSECKHYKLEFNRYRISSRIKTLDWLNSAIIAVSNTAAVAAQDAIKHDAIKHDAIKHDAIEHEALNREVFKHGALKINSGKRISDEIFPLLECKVAKGSLFKNYEYFGESGRRYKFDLAVNQKRLTLISTVVPNANSVNSRYVAFSDIQGERVDKIIAHNGDLSREHVTLLQKVATLAQPQEVVDLVTAKAA